MHSTHDPAQQHMIYASLTIPKSTLLFSLIHIQFPPKYNLQAKKSKKTNVYFVSLLLFVALMLLMLSVLVDLYCLYNIISC